MGQVRTKKKKISSWSSLQVMESCSVIFWRKGGGSPPAPSVSLVGSIESFTLELDLQLSDGIVHSALLALP